MAIAVVSFALRMRWRTKEVELRSGPKVFAHLAVQLDVLDLRTGRPRRTKLIDKFMEPAVAEAFLNTFTAGTTSLGYPVTMTGDYFETDAP